MKFFFILCTIGLYLTTASAQNVNYEAIMGTWQYKSPKGTYICGDLICS